MPNEDKYHAPIISALQSLSRQEQVALHMPGHKSGSLTPGVLTNWLGQEVLRYDQTEIGELDSLHSPSGPIAAAERLAANLYQVDATHFTTNGSSAGLIAALMAATSPGDSILLPRNVHKSVISGLVLADIDPIFLDPVCEESIVLGLTAEALQAALSATNRPKPVAVLLVYPGYEGGCSDISSLVRIAHNHGCTVIVDEAHGAHLKFHSSLPISATDAGADVVVQSAHKTLPALTGGAWVHVRGRRVSGERLRQCLNLVQSTSPSWLILGSLDAARLEMATRGRQLLDDALGAAARLEHDIRNRTPFKIWEITRPGFARDRLKVNIQTADCGYTGVEVAGYLQRAGIFPEMSSRESILFMLTVADVHQQLSTVVNVLARLVPLPALLTASEGLPPLPRCTVGPRTAYLADVQWVPLRLAAGRIAARSIYQYPPGIPLVVPGQVFEHDHVGYISQIGTSSCSLHGLVDGHIAVTRI